MCDQNIAQEMIHNTYTNDLPCPVLSLFPSFSLPDALYDPTDLIWRKGTPFEALTGRTDPSSDGLLADRGVAFG